MHIQSLPEEDEPVAAQNPLIGGLMVRCLTGACRANTQVANCPLTSIRVLVPQKILVIRGQ